jgi:hypothetical protein
VQAAKRPYSPNRDRDDRWQAGNDPAVEQDRPALDGPQVNESVRVIARRSAPTEPEVTYVTAASTSGLFVSDHERVVSLVLVQPGARRFVERDLE